MRLTTKENTPFQQHLDKVKAQYKVKDISHEQAYRDVSCNFGIEQLEIACKQFFLNYKELAGVYRAIENILYKLGMSTLPRIKRGVAIRLKYDINWDIISLMVRSTVSTIGKYYGIVKPHVKVANKLTYDPDFSKNADLYFLLTYLKKNNYDRRYYKTWSFQKIFFNLLHICGKKEPYDELVRVISSLVKEKILFARNCDMKLVKEKEYIIGKLLSDWNYYQNIYDKREFIDHFPNLKEVPFTTMSGKSGSILFREDNLGEIEYFTMGKDLTDKEKKILDDYVINIQGK